MHREEVACLFYDGWLVGVTVVAKHRPAPHIACLIILPFVSCGLQHRKRRGWVHLTSVLAHLPPSGSASHSSRGRLRREPLVGWSAMAVSCPKFRSQHVDAVIGFISLMPCPPSTSTFSATSVISKTQTITPTCVTHCITTSGGYEPFPVWIATTCM